MICAGAICIFAAVELAAVDGDTFKHVPSGRSFRIWGIDTSERGAPDYREHKDLMAEIIDTAITIQCQNRGFATTNRGSWQCVPTGGYYAQQDIALVMCDAGYAVDFPRFSGGYYAGCGLDP